MAVFRRREKSPGPFKHYSEYRPYVREDFSDCCAYCLTSELLGGGPESFELDHFRPKSLPQFASFESHFYNLYYSCRPCNLIKGNRWPDSHLETLGYGFVDLCAEAFSDHFEEDPEGVWKPLSRRAEYTLERLRLNRAHLCEIRRLLRSLAAKRRLPAVNWDIPAREQIRKLLD